MNARFCCFDYLPYIVSPFNHNAQWNKTKEIMSKSNPMYERCLLLYKICIFASFIAAS